MDESTAALASAIGSRIRQERKARTWTLDQLADIAGVSRRMLVTVEQGAANPSVGTLLRLSDALGVGLPALVEPAEPTPVKITRRGQGASLWHGEFGGVGVLVAGTEPPDVVELWDWTLGPGDRHASETHAPGTRELVQVLQGRVAIEIAGQVVTLGLGDAVTFPGDVPHSYANPAKKAARFCLAVFEPDGPGLVLACSDGLWNYVPDPADMAELAAGVSGGLLATASALTTVALEGGGHDNITAVLAVWPPRAPEPDAAERTAQNN